MKIWHIYTKNESGRYRRGAGFHSYSSALAMFERMGLSPDSSCIAPR
jgi:hypothetical protein